MQRREGQDGRDSDRHERQLEVDPGGHVDHGDKRGGRRNQRDQTLDRDVLERLGVLLHPVRGVRRANPVVIGKREALALLKQLVAEVQQELLARVRLQNRVAEVLDLGENGDRGEHECREDQYAVTRVAHRRGYQTVEESG